MKNLQVCRQRFFSALESCKLYFHLQACMVAFEKKTSGNFSRKYPFGKIVFHLKFLSREPAILAEV